MHEIRTPEVEQNGTDGSVPVRAATERTRARYDRLARVYDWLEAGSEHRFRPWRELIWKRVRGPRVLELGVGTGKNMPFYPPGMQITAIDLSPRMLERARARAARFGIAVDLREADVQALLFPDAHFDTVVATFVFCSVPDPMLGLAEVERVLRPDGQLLLLEHVLSDRPLLRSLMRLANPIVVRMMGANIDRETVENVRQATFADVRAEALASDIVWLIEARAPQAGTGNAATSR